MSIPSYPEWLQVYVAPTSAAGIDKYPVSAFDNVSSSNSFDNNIAVAQSPSFAKTSTSTKVLWRIINYL